MRGQNEAHGRGSPAPPKTLRGRNEVQDIISERTKNTDPGEIATAFGISRNTLHNWRNAYDEKGMAGLEDAPRSGRRPFASDADAKKCRDAAREEHGLVTRDRMRDKIRGNC